MQLVFKQRMFSWFDSYDIYDEDGNTVFTVKGQLAWGHCFKIFDSYGNEVGMLKEKVITFLPTFEIYIDGQYMGQIKKELSFFKPKFVMDLNDWYIEGGFMEWNYTVYGRNGAVMTVSKELMHMTDTYVLNVYNDEDALAGLLVALAIDAEKCSRNAGA